MEWKELQAELLKEFPYNMGSPKTTGDTIWIDYSQDRPRSYVYDEDRALAHWSNSENLSEAERYVLWLFYPRPGETFEVSASEAEVFDAMMRNTAYRHLCGKRRKEEKRRRRHERKQRKSAQLRMF